MKQYIDLVNDIIDNGVTRGDRTGTGTRSVFGRQLRFNLAEGFPLVTTKKVFLRGVIEELLWILRGETNINPLLEKNVHIWDEWATETGDLGPIYGEQLRSWFSARRDQNGNIVQFSYIDQMRELMRNLRERPFSRRHVITAWNPGDLPNESISPQENVKRGNMALAPCHCLFQFYMEPDHDKKELRLSCQLYQR